MRTRPNRDDVHDLRREAYVRVYEAAGKLRPTSAKSFSFATARNLMADRVRPTPMLATLALENRS